jgi:hypothetical protein
MMEVLGYSEQEEARVRVVNVNKRQEELILRQFDSMATMPEAFDARWLAVARTHIELGFMAYNRAVFRPDRVKLPEDAKDQGIGSS